MSACYFFVRSASENAGNPRVFRGIPNKAPSGTIFADSESSGFVHSDVGMPAEGEFGMNRRHRKRLCSVLRNDVATSGG